MIDRDKSSVVCNINEPTNDKKIDEKLDNEYLKNAFEHIGYKVKSDKELS